MSKSASPSRAFLPLLLLLAALAGGVERWTQGVPADDWPALFALWSAALGLPALCLALVARRLRVPAWALWLATLFPAAAITFNQNAHEQSWAHLALGIGGLQHWSRVACLVAVGLLGPAWLLGRLERGLAAHRRVCHLSATFLGLFVLVAAIWQFGPRRSAARGASASTTPDIVLISIDTLRQDALAPYGGPRTALDDWMAKAQVLQGFAPAPWTLPSLRALMRGAASSGAGGAQALAAPRESLPQSLQQAGFATAAFVSNAHLMSDYGFQAGFDHYDHANQIEFLLPARAAKLARWWTREWTERLTLELADRRADAALRWLAQRDPSRPYFLWVHLLDPHLPYYLRGEEGSRIVAQRPDWLGDLGAAFDGEKFFDLPGMRAGSWPTDGAFLAALRQLYRSEVDFTAWHAARVLEAAAQARADRPLLWIVTSDHGEEFFEHGGFEHGHALGQELLRVPLIVGGCDDALPAAMRLQDIAPWLLRRLQLPALPPPESIPQELQAAIAGEPTSACAPELLAGGMLYGDPQWRWIRGDGTSTLWRADSTAWRNNICEDPRDLHWIAAEVDSSEAAVRRAADAWYRRELEGIDALELDSELRERLQALGYLGG